MADPARELEGAEGLERLRLLLLLLLLLLVVVVVSLLLSSLVSLLKIHQRGVQWKQGVDTYMMLYTSLLCNTTPIHCTPLPLHPPVMNTQALAGGVPANAHKSAQKCINMY